MYSTFVFYSLSLTYVGQFQSRSKRCTVVTITCATRSPISVFINDKGHFYLAKVNEQQINTGAKRR